MKAYTASSPPLPSEPSPLLLGGTPSSSSRYSDLYSLLNLIFYRRAPISSWGTYLQDSTSHMLSFSSWLGRIHSSLSLSDVVSLRGGTGSTGDLEALV